LFCYILWRTFCARSRGCVFESVHSWFGPLRLCTDYIVLPTKTTRSRRATRKGMCLLLLHWCIESIVNYSGSDQENIFGPGAITVIGRMCPFRLDPCLSVGPLFGLGVVFFDPTSLWTRQTNNHTFCRLRNIQNNLYNSIVMYKIQNVYNVVYSININLNNE